MICVRIHGKACQFRVNMSTAFFCMFQLFQHNHAAAFTHDKPVAGFVKRTGSCLGIIIAVGTQRFHILKAGNSNRIHCRFHAAGNHYVRITVLDGP